MVEVVGPRVRKLIGAIETTHKCKAVHVGTKMVAEFFQELVAWNGIVKIFGLEGHPKAKRCYAWSYPVTNDTQYVTVLEIPPVNSVESAVRRAIASGQQK